VDWLLEQDDVDSDELEDEDVSDARVELELEDEDVSDARVELELELDVSDASVEDDE